MTIELISAAQDKFPQCGFFVEGPNLDIWLTCLNDMNLDPEKLELFALPTKEANTIWGCLVLTPTIFLTSTLGRLTAAHHISNNFIIPEKTKLVPELTQYDFDHLLGPDRYVFHFDIGLFKLEEPIVLGDHIKFDVLNVLETTKPISYTPIDFSINSFRIEATPIEDLKFEMEAKPKRKKLENKPLNLGEQAKLKLYQQFLKVEESKDGKVVIEKPSASTLEKLAQFLGLVGPTAKETIMRDFEDLMERNKREVEKLMDMLDKNPEDALKYAIPLDEHGYSRAKNELDFKMQDRGSDFSLFSTLVKAMGAAGGLSGSGGSVNLGDEYFKLQEQYRRTAETLKQKGDYEKSAYVYLKLLKDYSNAALTLRNGKSYEKAAYVYLKYLKDELNAAACYEEGKIYDKAIELYEKNDKLEKTGDLYILLGKRKKANRIYQKVVDDYIEKSRYVQASSLCKQKLDDHIQTQQILLNGWKNKVDEQLCLSNYFKNITHDHEAWEQVNYIKDHHLNKNNDVSFLKVLKNEYRRRTTFKSKLRDLGYVIISDLLERGLISSSELLEFNEKDKRLQADSIRYNINKTKRMKE